MKCAVACFALVVGCHSAMAPPDDGSKQWIGQFRLEGVTSDGYAIVADAEQSGIAVIAVALDGSSQQLIIPDAIGAGVVGRVAFAVRQSAGNQITTVWSSTASAHDLDVPNLYPAASSTDGQYLAFRDDTAIYLARTDGTREEKVSDFSTQMGMCPVQFGFVGARLVILRCATDLVLSTVTSIELSSFMPIDIATRATSFVGDHAGTHVAVLSAKGAQILPVIGGDGISVDGDFADARFLPDDSALIFTTADATLQRAPVTGAAPTVLQNMGALGLLGVVSTDGKSLLYDSQRSSTGSDLFLASSQHAGAPMILSADPSAALFGDSFTDDSVLALYSAGVAARVDPETGPFIGGLDAQAVGGGAAIHLTDLVWQWNTVGGSRVLYDDNLVNLSTSSFTGSADLELVDLAQGRTPKTLAKSIDLAFYLSPDHKAAVYTASGSLYFLPLP